MSDRKTALVIIESSYLWMYDIVISFIYSYCIFFFFFFLMCNVHRNSVIDLICLLFYDLLRKTHQEQMENSWQFYRGNGLTCMQYKIPIRMEKFEKNSSLHWHCRIQFLVFYLRSDAISLIRTQIYGTILIGRIWFPFVSAANTAADVVVATIDCFFLFRCFACDLFASFHSIPISYQINEKLLSIVYVVPCVLL